MNSGKATHIDNLLNAIIEMRLGLLNFKTPRSTFIDLQIVRTINSKVSQRFRGLTFLFIDARCTDIYES